MTNEERNVFEQFGYTTDSIKTECLLELAEETCKAVYLAEAASESAYWNAEALEEDAQVAKWEYSENAWDIWCNIVRHIVNEEIKDDKSARAYFLARCNWRSMTELYFESGVESHRLKEEEGLVDKWEDLTRELFIGSFTVDVIREERRMQS